jgi:hypothetical protein
MQWMKGLAILKKKKPEQFSSESYQRARAACLPAHMPEFERPGATFF